MRLGQLDPTGQLRDHTAGRSRILIVDGDIADTAATITLLTEHLDAIVGVAATTPDAVQAVHDDPQLTLAIVDPLHLAQGGVQVLAQLRAVAPHLVILTYCDLRPAVIKTLAESGVARDRMISKGDHDGLLAAIATATVEATR